MLGTGMSGLPFRINGANAHYFHQPSHTLAVDAKALGFQPRGHLATAVEWCLRVLLVEQAHQAKVFFCLFLRCVVITRPVDLEQFALTPDTDFFVCLYP